ncbi:dirigent protein 1-like [Andrographis paniculata]|uniref:dirigent protein 1-like n=1 Tax=Andrographis paniculata TaxID=175694 RepID=UPI0021E7986A|nr:dirigent protein 1-like [Andrographis paniculata]
MENLKLILVLISWLNILANSQTQTTRQLTLRNVSIIKLTFYTHPTWIGTNETLYSVARASITDQVPSRFGVLEVCDVLVTYGPENESKKLGRIQGTATSVDLKETAFGVMLTVVFTQGEYKGSTINLMGRNPIMNKERELAVVGGSGAFPRAWGYAITSTYSTDEYGINFVAKYDVVLFNETYA